MQGPGEAVTAKASQSKPSSRRVPKSSVIGTNPKFTASPTSSVLSQSIASRSIGASSLKPEESLRDVKSSRTSKNSKKSGFRPGDKLSRDQSERIASDTQKQLKQKVRTKFASGEADIDAERFINDEVSVELENEDGSLWDDGDEAQGESIVEKVGTGPGGATINAVANGSSAILSGSGEQRSVRFTGTNGMTVKSVTGSASSAVGESWNRVPYWRMGAW